MGKLKTRKPTGEAAYPLVLVEGLAKSGKGWSWASFSASERVGRMVAIVTGERDADEYFNIPGADFELAIHDGTYRSILTQVQGACEELKFDDKGRPPVIVLDSASNLWSLLKDEAQAIADRRAKNKNYYKEDEETKIHMDLWNNAKQRWRRIIDPLMSFPGIVIVTARGKETADADNLKSGKKVWKVEGHKSLPFDVDVWIRTLEPKKAALIGARSVKRGISPNTNKMLPEDWTLDGVIFGLLECGRTKDPQYTPVQTEGEESIVRDPVDYSKDEGWQSLSRRLHALIKEVGLNGKVSQAVRNTLKEHQKVESYNHLSPGYLKKVVAKLASLSVEEGPAGEVPPRMAHILKTIGMTPQEATADMTPTDDAEKEQPPAIENDDKADQNTNNTNDTNDTPGAA